MIIHDPIFKMNSATEIRKLPPSNIRELVQILEYSESWKRLMEIIPKTLEKENYACGVTYDNPSKYHSEHFRLIENASLKLHRPCAEILLDEWGTSGRIRPALGHLLHLLVKAQLFRAADFVAIDLLRTDTPQRPKHGPAARVTFTDEQIEIEYIVEDMPYDSDLIARNGSRNNSPERNGNSIERFMENITYSSSDFARANRNTLEENLDRREVPKIVITDVTEESDMMKFSRVSEENNEVQALVQAVESVLPQISSLLKSEISEESLESESSEEFQVESSSNLPEISDLLNDHEDSSPNIPQLSNLIGNGDESNVPQLSELLNGSDNNDNDNNDNDNIPPISALLQSETTENSQSEENIPQISALIGDSGPNLSDLLPEQPQLVILMTTSRENLHTPEQVSPISSMTIPSLRSSPSSLTNSRPSCHSPLPNLSLNTLLPHYSYQELEIATNNFDETPHTSEDEGRFLGSGAFGSVYLALGLLPKPVAVKKLYLNGEQVVEVDDAITRQFRNEVEVLCRYNHENLLGICGYSCDGPTYCLMYDYISGGALNYRLEKCKQELDWKQRLSIAAGTAEAAAYLHSAFSTPLIHRDIKTANILLDSSNKPKLGDFGIIKLSPNQNTTVSTTIIGTSVYMAPETFRSGDVSVKTDSFSFGVVVLELLTALAPLDENREARDLISHVEETCEEGSITPLLDLSAGSWITNDVNVAESMFNIANKCLEEKKRRPSMVDVRDQLNELVLLIQ